MNENKIIDARIEFKAALKLVLSRDKKWKNTTIAERETLTSAWRDKGGSGFSDGRIYKRKWFAYKYGDPKKTVFKIKFNRKSDFFGRKKADDREQGIEILPWR